MPVKDTITIIDSLTCRYILIDKPKDLSSLEVINPINSLWKTGTLSKTFSGEFTTKQNKNPEDYILSGFILLYLILSGLFFRELLATGPNIVKSCFSLKAQKAIEEKLSSVNQRNITALISAIFLTLFIVFTFGNFFNESTGIDKYLLIPASFGIITVYWIFKSLILRFGGWITKAKQPFSLIGKIGYNHFILATMITIPLIIVPIFTTNFNELILVNILSISYLIVFILYLIRVYQIIISYHFSHFFYILYLCTVEILPIALFINFLLS